MSNLGDRAVGSLVMMQFTTAVNGVPTDLAGTPAISVYKNSLTESTAGVTLTQTYDTLVGLNHLVIDTSADGSFYASGDDFSVVITTGTLGGVSMVGYEVGTFSLNLGNVSTGTVANLTNAPTSGDLTATMKTSVTTAATAATPTAAAVTGAVGSVTARVTANTDQIAGSASAATDLGKTTNAIARGTVTTGGSTTSVPTSAFTLVGGAASGVVADQFKGRTILFDGNTTTAGLCGASGAISASSASNTPTLTVGTLPATPTSGDIFSVI